MSKQDSSRCRQYDEISVDSGFNSDSEQKQFDQLGEKLNSSSLNITTAKESCCVSNNYSLPSLRYSDDSAIDWSKLTLNDFEHVRYLGGGGYARVDLLQFKQ